MPRPLSRADRARVLAALEQWASTGGIVALRTRALILLAADTGLRVRECCALELGQVVVDGAADRTRLQSSFYLRPGQAKARSGGIVHVSKRARAAILAYLRALRAAGWVDWPAPARTPLFLGHRGYQGRVGHGRLSVRAAQRSWHEAQARARLGTRYGFHSLRHDAASRLRASGADVIDLAKQMRWRDLNHAARYVHELDSHKRLKLAVDVAAKLG